ncbi:MAG: uracil-DNA glycosylase [Thermoplasmata archaeon]|nr:uracil-DNA glycosylase [Thermoplasmata archaeon]
MTELRSDSGPSGVLPDSPRPGTRSPEWKNLVEEITGCRRCSLGASRTHVVIYRGAEEPVVLFVGEAPGADEDRAGVPFVGRAGRRLDSAIERIGLSPDEFGVLNLIKCRPPANVFDRKAAAACRPFLERQLSLLRPKLVVPLGAQALRALAPEAPPITQASGVGIRRGAWMVFPLLHPAAAMHAPRYRAQWDAGVDALAAQLPALLTEGL